MDKWDKLRKEIEKLRDGTFTWNDLDPATRKRIINEIIARLNIGSADVKELLEQIFQDGKVTTQEILDHILGKLKERIKETSDDPLVHDLIDAVFAGTLDKSFVQSLVLRWARRQLADPRLQALCDAVQDPSALPNTILNLLLDELIAAGANPKVIEAIRRFSANGITKQEAFMILLIWAGTSDPKGLGRIAAALPEPPFTNEQAAKALAQYVKTLIPERVVKIIDLVQKGDWKQILLFVISEAFKPLDPRIASLCELMLNGNVEGSAFMILKIILEDEGVPDAEEIAQGLMDLITGKQKVFGDPHADADFLEDIPGDPNCAFRVWRRCRVVLFQAQRLVFGPSGVLDGDPQARPKVFEMGKITIATKLNTLMPKDATDEDARMLAVALHLMLRREFQAFLTSKGFNLKTLYVPSSSFGSSSAGECFQAWSAIWEHKKP